MNFLKHAFLRRRENSLRRAVRSVERNLSRFTNEGKGVLEFEDLTYRLNDCLIELRAIRSAIRDKADELGGAA